MTCIVCLYIGMKCTRLTYQCGPKAYSANILFWPNVCSALAFCEPEQNKQFEKWRDGLITFWSPLIALFVS